MSETFVHPGLRVSLDPILPFEGLELEIYMLPGQMEEEAWPDPLPLPLVSK